MTENDRKRPKMTGNDRKRPKITNEACVGVLLPSLFTHTYTAHSLTQTIRMFFWLFIDHLRLFMFVLVNLIVRTP